MRPNLTADRFAELLAVETDECVPFPTLDSDGYGRLVIGGRYLRTSILACIVSSGPRPDGLLAVHSCANRACMNPRHLRWGTRQQNADDMVAHGNSTRGRPPGNTKMTEDAVRAMRAEHAEGATARELAERFELSPQQVANIVRGPAWSWVH